MLKYILLPMLCLIVACGPSEPPPVNDAPANDAPAPLATGPDWPTFRGDAAQSGSAAAKLPPKPELLWTFETDSEVTSTAAIVGGTVYVGTVGGELLALDLAGAEKPRWRYDAGGAIEAAPGVRDGRVFVGDDQGVFHTVDAKTGTLIGKFETGDKIVSSANFSAGGDVLFGSYDARLYCLAPKGLRWKGETDAPVHGSPCVAGGKAYVAGCDGLLRAFEIDTGKPSGALELGGRLSSSLAWSQGRLYLGTLSGQILCVRDDLSEIIWQLEVEDTPAFFAAAATDGERVVLAGGDGVVRCVSAEDGSALWTFKARDVVDSSPVIVDGRVLFGSDDGNLYAVGLDDGKETWRFEAGSPITASPAVGGGRLVIGTGDGAIYCFGSKR
jgi:eukaryotic-like serine/threonine-protein kinase